MAAEVEDDFLEESSSKPIFYSPEVEEAISQVSKIQQVCCFLVKYKPEVISDFN